MSTGIEASEGVIENWWRQAMMGSAKAPYDCVDAFADEDHSDDLRGITVPVLVMHSEDDQIVPYGSSAPRAAALLTNGTLVTYTDLPHGMPTTHPDVINADLLDFIKA